jgi:hypothetical protein
VPAELAILQSKHMGEPGRRLKIDIMKLQIPCLSTYPDKSHPGSERI